MPINRKRRVITAIESHVDEIIGKLANNPAVDKPAKLPINVESLQEKFNAQLEMFLEQNFVADERALLRETLMLDESKIFSDDESVMLVKIFNAGTGLFGFGDTGGNFKILSLCFTKPQRRFDEQALNLLFDAFTKVFLPEVAASEVIAVLLKNHFFVAESLIFELVQTGELNMLNVFVE